MTERPLDPRRERLVSLLYGELDRAEEEALRREIAGDDALRRDWEELVSAREILRGWEVEEKSPSFLFLDQDEPVRRPRSGGWIARFRRKVGGFSTAAPWAVATAALVIAVLSMSGLRVVRTPEGFALRAAGQETPAAAVAPPAGELASGAGRLEDPPVRPAAGGPSLLTVEDLMANPELSPYMTRYEFEAYAAGMMQTITTLLNEYARERDAGVGAVLTDLIGTMERRRDEDYLELRGRIEEVRVVHAEQEGDRK